ncbi:glutamate--tRNA ligase [Alphaproteobacteria bacterium]|nr:glutamate--tRNA ligase [Alphaproteobacteria bacterium]
MSVITRFAPSPTGYLHIGGARTAIFNFLFSRKHKGKYLVRIEDTDLKRSTNEAVKAIHDGLEWLNVYPSDKIIYQSQEIKSHVKIAFELLEKGFAYKCYLNSEELTYLRTKSRENGTPIKSPWRDKITNSNDDKFVIRLKMPSYGITTIHDLVQGEVTVNNEILDDMIILRSDKSPTYMLSSVVDDYNMGVTHIIRGDDHLNNAFRQIQIIKFLNWKEPSYAHIPLIHGSDGSKLSKRHGATSIIDYSKMGYTTEAMFFYLLQLGWTANNDSDFDLNKIINEFSLEKINKSPAKFDMQKLNNINSKILRQKDPNEILELITHHFSLDLENIQKNRLKAFLPELLKRVNTYVDIEEDLEWITVDNFVCTDKDKVLMLKNNKLILKEISLLLNECNWSKDNIDNCLKQYIIEKSIKFKDIGPVLRTALTGKTNSPDLVTIIYELGCTITLNRLNYIY